MLVPARANDDLQTTAGSLHPHFVLCMAGLPLYEMLQGRWSKEEDEKLRELVSERGPSWKDIGIVLGRLPEGCRDRSQFTCTASHHTALHMLVLLHGNNCVVEQQRAAILSMGAHQNAVSLLLELNEKLLQQVLTKQPL